MAIEEFEGGAVIVSHDFRLISQVAEDLWEVKDNNEKPHLGGYHHYRLQEKSYQREYVFAASSDQ
ncbi:hypothetical protein EDC04DRAFT_2662019 [Pisolithus marmoratus]|nr:hypothetical protein EDC04DRAFT_2662019 [Pisolithus marmoratus]